MLEMELADCVSLRIAENTNNPNHFGSIQFVSIEINTRFIGYWFGVKIVSFAVSVNGKCVNRLHINRMCTVGRRQLIGKLFWTECRFRRSDGGGSRSSGKTRCKNAIDVSDDAHNIRRASHFHSSFFFSLLPISIRFTLKCSLFQPLIWSIFSFSYFSEQHNCLFIIIPFQIAAILNFWSEGRAIDEAKKARLKAARKVMPN